MRHDKRREGELLALERKFWTAIKERDGSTAQSLSDDSCVVVGAQGVGEIGKAALAGMLEGAPHELKAFGLDQVHIRHVTDDVAVVAYQVDENLVVEGQNLNLKAYDASVWVRRDGHWVCVVHTESVAGDPYGRH